VAELGAATVLTTSEQFKAAGERRAERQAQWQALAERAQVSRTWGDCYGYLLVATGRAEVMCDATMAPWDAAAAALAPVIREAGGVFTDWDGAPRALGPSAVATNAALAAEVRGVLSRPRR
jgi:fructose-1,6-bisphosphatase/inositol monophosphatase family enzyme